MIDLHAHFLPGIDDGSKSRKESAQMLETAFAQGVDVMVATPHFYPDRERPDTFLQKRQRVLELIPYDAATMPEILLGAEVAYFDGMSRCDELQRLCIGNSALLLLEMPFAPWTERVLEDVCALKKNLEITPVLAHIERYFSYMPDSGVLDRLQGEGIYFQSNAESFLGFFRGRRAMKMLRNRQIHFLGSDCHGMEHRVPNLGAAVNKILQTGAVQCYREMELRACRLLGLKNKTKRSLK